MPGPIVAITQARMTSTRLPGKVLREVAGRTLLEWHLLRLRRSRRLDRVVVATTVNASDDPIEELCARLGVPVYRGDEHDVLSRYAGAAAAHDAATVVRITSDCPLIDPDEIDRLIEVFIREEAAYASNAHVRRFPRGLDAEVMSRAALETAQRDARERPDREHVTLYLRRQPWLFPHASVVGETDCSQHRWTVDTPADLELVSRLITGLGAAAAEADWRRILALVEAHPGWAQLNQEVVQKPALVATVPRCAYRCLPSQSIRHGDRRLEALQPELFEPIRRWRNAQIGVLRQQEPLTPEAQQRYVDSVVRPQYGQERPAQVLFSYWWQELLLGYGGLVHLDWPSRRGEVSILLDPARARDIPVYQSDLAAYLPLIAGAAFNLLGLERLTSEAYDVRPHHVAVIEAFGFRREGVLRQHVVKDGRRVDALLHGMLRGEAREVA